MTDITLKTDLLHVCNLIIWNINYTQSYTHIEEQHTYWLIKIEELNHFHKEAPLS